MISTDQIYLSESAIEALNQAVTDLLPSLPEYQPEQIEKALLFWFESSLESLADDALFHLVDGRSDLTIGRTSFNKFLAKITHEPRQLSESDSRLTSTAA